MKKFNLFKKIGVSVLSLIVAGSIGGACLSSSNAQAAYDYSQVAKTDEYVEGLFSKNERVYATITLEDSFIIRDDTEKVSGNHR